MTTGEVEKHLYWADANGDIWARESYCLEPTADFVRISNYGPSCERKADRMSGAIGCRNFSGLKPITMPEFKNER